MAFVDIDSDGDLDLFSNVNTTSIKRISFFRNIQMLNTTFLYRTNSFSAVATTGAAALAQGSKYSGAAAVGTKVYFAPYVQNNVGIYDTATSTFSAVGAQAAPVHHGAGDQAIRGGVG